MIAEPDPDSTTHSINLSIAKLHFSISSQNLPLLLKYDTFYDQFLTTRTDTPEGSIEVSLQLKETMSDITNLPRIFETPETWYMLSDSTDKYIVFQPPNNPNIAPLWIARIDSGLQNIDVFCDTKRLANESNVEFIDNPIRYPLDQILLINCLLGKGVLIHAAGIVIEGKGYIFAGPSGAGKSTICTLFQELTHHTILSDDRMVIQKSANDFLMYGTPWPGDAGIAENDSAVLHGIFFLRHAEENSIERLSARDSLDSFFKVTSLPLYDKDDMQKSLAFCEDLLEGIKTYKLNFKPGPEIIDDLMSVISD